MARTTATPSSQSSSSSPSSSSSNGNATIDYAPPTLVVPSRRFLTLDPPSETIVKRLIFVLTALLITAGHFFFTHAFWAPAHIGNNQSAYLVAGRLIATEGRVSLEPESPYEFVGWMWNTIGGFEPKQLGGGPYYPKYPLGLPMLNALAFKIGGDAHGAEFMHLVSPVCASLAVLAVFFFTRELAGSFAGALAMILYGTLTVPIMQANNPYSHAPAVAFVAWGMYFLLRWWQFGGAWRGILAGFLLGYAATIRYTEGLFVLPLALAALFTVRWRFGQSYRAAMVPMLAWAVPICLLVAFNCLTFGSPTGYDSTKESSAFKWDEFGEKWQYTVAQLNGTGLYLLFPLSVLGLCLAIRWNWRAAILLFAWFVPSTLVYTAYYWGQSLPLWGFLRFFATVLPAGVIAAAWLIERAIRTDATTPRINRALAPIAAGLFVAAPVTVNAFEVLSPLERDHVLAYNLADVGVHVKREIPSKSVVFGQSQFLLNYLQVTGDHTFYGSDFFAEGRPVPRWGGDNQSDPNPIQPERKKFIDSVYQNSTPRERMEKGMQIMIDALKSGRRVFMVHGAIGASGLYKKLQNDERFTLNVREAWAEPWRMTEKAAKTLGSLSVYGAAKREPWKWQIIEITLRSNPTTAPLE